MIRTAIPFGYLIIALFLFAIVVIGILVFFFAGRFGFPRARWGGLVAVGLVVALVFADVAFSAKLELNPWIQSNASVIGTWSDGSQALTLTSDGSFKHETESGFTEGTWEREDWNLELHSGGNAITYMRFIQYGDELRLLTSPLGDPDTWDGDLGLRLEK